MKDGMKELADEQLMDAAGWALAEKAADAFTQYRCAPEIERPELAAVIQKLIDKNRREIQRNEAWKTVRFVLSRVAVAALVLVVVFATAFVTVEAFRKSVLNFFAKETPEYVRYGNNATLDDIIAAGFHYRPVDVPLDYWISSVEQHRTRPKIYYTNAEGETIVFQQVSSNQTLTFDNEVGYRELIYVMDTRLAVITEAKGEKVMTWSNDDFAFVVRWSTANIYFDAGRFANGIQKIK